MPEAIPIIVGIISAAGVGTSIYSLANQPGTPKPAVATPAQNATTAANTRTSQESAISQQLPGLQEQVGGSLSPDALLQLAALASGQTGQPGSGGSIQDLLAKFNGGGGSTGSGLTPGGAYGG